MTELPSTVYGTTTLGDLIDALDQRAKRDPSQQVRFDFCHAAPGALDSCRGYYEHLAIEFEFDYSGDSDINSVLKRLQAAVGGTYQGYKGGSFTMSRKTPIWVANYGHTGSAIVGIHDCDYCTVLETAWIP